MSLSEFGVFVRNRRNELHMELSRCADELGVHPTTLSALETGNKAVPMRVVRLLGDILQLNEEQRVLLAKLARPSRRKLWVPVYGVSPELLDRLYEVVDQIEEELS